jgi:16S rRNA processing protein RimM
MIKVGIITNTKGFDGTLFIDSVPSYINSIKKDSIINVGFTKKFTHEYKIENINKTTNGFNIKFNGLNSKEDAIKLKEHAVFANENDIIKISSNKFNVSDLMGFDVINFDTGAVIGILSDEYSIPSNDIWIVKSNEKEILIPVADDFIKKIDHKNRLIKINVIPGLLEANENSSEEEVTND